MSFTSIPSKPTRVNRSQLFVPGSKPDLFKKASESNADIICLDLEDAVAPQDKDAAKQNVIKALNDHDFGTKTISVRINGLDTHYCYRDVVDLMENTGEKLDLIMIPKVGVPEDVYAIDMLVTQIEDKTNREKKIGFELIVETSMGITNLDRIITGSKRIESLHFGYADYAASVRMRTTNIGGSNQDYSILTDEINGNRKVHWNDMWHYPISKMTTIGRAHGLRIIDGPYGDFSDPEGFKSHAKRTAILGCEGKWAIHPSQVDLANEVFTLPEKEVQKARDIINAMKKAQESGAGAATLNGKLIDAASIRQAEQIIEQTDLINKLS
ncbi:CoA ester lyase [Pelagibacteraceae bacterium]|nr:CoA ester lyase [Pelagibacteraceae bacterium]